MAHVPAGPSVDVQKLYSKAGGERTEGRSRSRSPGGARGTPLAFPIDPSSLRLLPLPTPAEVRAFRLDPEKGYEEHPTCEGPVHELQHRKVDELWSSKSSMVVYKPPYKHMCFDYDGERGHDDKSMTRAMRDLFNYPTIQHIGKAGSAKVGGVTIDCCNAGLAHRLDRETSGCVLVGKVDEAWLDLKEQFGRKDVYKEYICLTNGVISKGGFIDEYIKPANIDERGSKS